MKRIVFQLKKQMNGHKTMLRDQFIHMMLLAKR